MTWPRSRRLAGAVSCALPSAGLFAGLAAPALVVLTLVGCTGATLGSGVGDTRLEEAPWYAGRPAPAGARVAYLPVAYQAGGTGTASFEPAGGPGSPAAALLDAMNADLDSLFGGRLIGPLAPPDGVPPDVQFGCDLDAADECVMVEEAEGFGPPTPSMRLAVGRPSDAWTGGVRQALVAAGADAVVVLTLEVGQYWPRQTNWRGSKAVDLGTGRTVALPWLTSLETPLQVVQLTGALVGPDGKAIRIGAEGLMAVRTPIAASGFGLQAVVRDEDLAALLTERVGDGPGAPLVRQVALRAMLSQLAGLRPGVADPPASRLGPPTRLR